MADEQRFDPAEVKALAEGLQRLRDEMKDAEIKRLEAGHALEKQSLNALAALEKQAQDFKGSLDTLTAQNQTLHANLEAHKKRTATREWVLIAVASVGIVVSLLTFQLQRNAQRAAKAAQDKAQEEAQKRTRADVNKLLHEAFYLLGGDVKSESITKYTTDPEKIVEAKLKIETAKTKDPNHALVYLRMAGYFNAKGQVDAAIEQYDIALELDPGFAQAYNNRGNAYRAKGELDRAIQDYEQALSLDPKDAFAYNNRGNVYRAKGALDRAIQDYDQAIALDPNYAVAYSNRGNAYREKGDPDRAIQDYQQAITLDSNYANPHYSLGNVYRQQGNLESAKTEFETYLKLVADTPENRIRIERTKTYLKNLNTP